MSAILATLNRRIAHLLGLGRITIGDDSGSVQMQQVKLNELEIRDNTPRLAEFGFTSMPPVDSDAVVLFRSGEHSYGVIVATGHQSSRMKGLKPGEAAIYDDQGQSVYLTRAGIVINGAGLPMTIKNTPKVRIESRLEVTKDIIDNCDTNPRTVADMRTIYNGHNHSDPQGGVVGAPTPQA